MELILKIAWRNIQRHKGKSIIIGVILFLGSLIMTVGNGVISGMNYGLERNIVESFMGDIVIISDKEQTDNILFKMMGKSIETINNYKEIKTILETQDYIAGNLPVGKNAAMVINESEGEPGYAYLLGVDFKEYKKFFSDNISPIEGSLLGDNEKGMLMAQKAREQLYETMNVWFVPYGAKADEKNFTPEAKENAGTLIMKGDPVFLGFAENNSTSDVRVPVKGIIRYRALNTIWGHFTILDIESYRKALGYFSAADSQVTLTGEKKKLFDSDNLDSMFGSSSIVVADTGSREINVDFKRRDQDSTAGIDLEAGTYNLIFIKLKKGTSMDDGVERLNKAFEGKNLGVRAVTWKQAAGTIGSMATIIKSILFIFVMLLFVVAIIIIVNTLTMATLERVTEIGMMRAVGARKGFISWMFIGETGMLSGIFGGTGIITGIIIVRIIPLLNITSDNDFVQLLFGGDRFYPVLTFTDILLVILQLLLVTLITVIYPVKVARSIVPLDAISRD